MKLRDVGMLVMGAAAVLLAQNPGIQRTILLKQDLSVPGREVNVASVTISPGGSAGRHTHPGEEISYILDGEGEILVEGKEPLKLKAGQAFVIPNGARHDARNLGTTPLKLVAVYVVEKGKPMATPAPQ